MKKAYENLQEVEVLFENQLLWNQNLMAKKSLSSNPIADENVYTFAKPSNHHKEDSVNIFDSNLNDEELYIEPRPHISNGVIFSRISKTNDSMRKGEKSVENYRSKFNDINKE